MPCATCDYSHFKVQLPQATIVLLIWLQSYLCVELVISVRFPDQLLHPILIALSIHAISFDCHIVLKSLFNPQLVDYLEASELVTKELVAYLYKEQLHTALQFLDRLDLLVSLHRVQLIDHLRTVEKLCYLRVKSLHCYRSLS